MSGTITHRKLPPGRFIVVLVGREGGGRGYGDKQRLPPKAKRLPGVVTSPSSLFFLAVRFMSLFLTSRYVSCLFPRYVASLFTFLAVTVLRYVILRYLLLLTVTF